MFNCISGKNIKLGISFRKCGVRYNSVLLTAGEIGGRMSLLGELYIKGHVRLLGIRSFNW